MNVMQISPDEYHADLVGTTPTLSSSTIKTLLNQSPAHAWAGHPKLNPAYTRIEDDKFNVGTVAHSLILENDDSKVAVIYADDWRTKVAKEARDIERSYGKIPLLERQWLEVQEAVARIRENVAKTNATPALFVDGTPEQTITWEENGVQCRALIDWLHDDHTAVDDLKTTERSANPDPWTRNTLFSIGADIQAAFYQRGCQAVFGVVPAFRFVVAETYAPYAVSVVSLGPDVLELANRKIDYALGMWKTCLMSGVWPAYPTDVCYAQLPPWEESRWLEREMRESA